MRKATADLQKAEELLAALGEDERARSLTELRKAADDPALRVVVFGEFNRGKSTLINALLGREALPAKLIPTTGHVTRVMHGTTEEVRVKRPGGQVEKCGLGQLDSFAALNDEGRAREDVEVIEVAVNAPLLRTGLVLIDTPGVKEHEAQTRRARQAIAQADLVLLVLDARQLLSAHERELAVDWLSRGLGKPVAVVLNFLNVIEEHERGDVRARVDRWCRANLRAALGRSWFEVNARGALAHAVGRGPAPADDFAALGQGLAGCTDGRRMELQRHSRAGQLLAEVRQARADNDRVLQRLRTDAARLEQERAAHRCELEVRRRRSNTEAKAQRDRVLTFAQKALDDNLHALVSYWFANESKERLEANAGGWYERKLTEAVRAVEKEGDGALLGLAGEGLRRPDPLTIRERMLLKARLDVGALAAVNASDNAVGWGAGIGAAIGTFVLPFPGVGTVAGAIVGGWLANWLGSTAPDYVAAYGAKARERWATDGCAVRKALEGQFDARVEGLRRQLKEADSGAGGRHDGAGGSRPEELRRREALHGILEACERQLQPA